jgi:hypothetical protein
MRNDTTGLLTWMALDPNGSPSKIWYALADTHYKGLEIVSVDNTGMRSVYPHELLDEASNEFSTYVTFRGVDYVKGTVLRLITEEFPTEDKKLYVSLEVEGSKAIFKPWTKKSSYRKDLDTEGESTKSLQPVW